MGRGISLKRLAQLWHCERKKEPVEYKLWIKFLGGEGIDTGVLSREFLANLINDIAKIVSKCKSSTFNTLHSEWEFRAIGEIVVASLAQKWASTMLLGSPLTTC